MTCDQLEESFHLRDKGIKVPKPKAKSWVESTL